MFQEVNQAVAVGADTENSPEQMEIIAQQGYKGVLDLCAPPEPKKLDKDVVTRLGLSYSNLPITPANLNEATLQSFVETLEAAPKPLYVRCASGLRASIFTILALMEKQDLNYSQTLQKWGIQPKADCPVNAFAKAHLKAMDKSV